MRKVLIYLLFIFTVTTWSCDKNDNSYDKPCFTAPTSFMFELVDKVSGENLFTTGVLSSSDITFLNLDDQSEVEFQFIDENDLNVIQISSIGWETQIVTYSIETSSGSLFTLFVDAERLNENGCEFTRYNQIDLDGSEFEFNDQSGIYIISVE